MDKQASVRTFDPLFDYSKRSTAQTLAMLYELQAALYFPFEVGVLHTSIGWHSPQPLRVLDVGTGAGSWLARTAAVFTQHNYVGLDLSADMIALARESHPTLSFVHGDLRDYQQPIDCAIARFVFQHLSEPALAAESLANVLSRHGRLIILETARQLEVESPEIPQLRAMYTSLQEQRQSVGADHWVNERLAHDLESTGRWRKLRQYDVVVPSTVNGNLTRMLRLQRAIARFLESAEVLPAFDFKALRRELRLWERMPNPYMQAGISVLELEPIIRRS